MLIYLICFSICIFFHYLADKTNVRLYKLILIFFPILLLSLLAGFRDMGIGTDTEIYSEMYFEGAMSLNSLTDLFTETFDLLPNKGYIALNYFSQLLYSELWMVWFLQELLILCCTYCAVLKIGKRYDIQLYVFSILYLFAFYNVSYNYMRQLCAMSICLLAMSYYFENKKIVFLLLFTIAFFFHTSSSICFIILAIYHISKKKVNLTKVLLCLFVGYIILFFYYYDVLFIIGRLGVFSEVYMDRYGVDTPHPGERVPYSFMIIILVIYCGLWLSWHKKIISREDIVFVILVHTTFLFMMFLSLYAETLKRLSYYSYLVVVVYMGICLSSERMSRLYRIFFLLLIIFAWWYSYMHLNGNETYPYKSTILGI